MTPEERALVSGYLSGQLPPEAALEESMLPRNSLGQPIRPSIDVRDLDPNKGGGWQLRSASGQPLGPVGDAAVSSVPAPQPVASPPINQSVAPPLASSSAVPLAGPAGPAALSGVTSGPPTAGVRTGTTVPTGPADIQALARAGASRVPGTGGVGAAVGGPPGWLQKEMARTDGEPSLDAGLNPHRVGLVVKPELPDETAALDQSLSEGFAAQRQQGEAEITRAEQTADRAVTAADEQAGVDAAMAQRELDRQSQLQKMDAHFQELSDELANQDIRAPSVFGETVGDQILNRIALFIGTIGSGVSGQPNLVWDKLNKDVERSIAADKETRQLKREQLGDQAKMIDMVRARFQDERVVDATLREAKYRKIAAELGRFAEYAKTPERKAALESLMAQADGAITQAAIQRRQAADAAVLQERAIRARAAARPDPLAQMVKRSGQLATLAENQRKITGTTPEDQKLEVPGYGRARSPEGAGAMNTVVQSADELQTNLRSLENLTERGSGTTGAFGVGSSDYKEANTLVETAVAPALAKVMASGFNPSGPTEERANALASGLTSKSAETRAATRKAIEKRIRAGVDAAGERHIQGYKRGVRVGEGG